MGNSHLFVVVPTFNNAKIIRATVSTLVREQYQVVVVDDGSKEDILAEIVDLPVHYIRHAINLGQGAALQTGMQYALQKYASIIVHFDADGQHNAKDIPLLVEPILNHEVDVVLGSRFLRKQDRLAVPLPRRVLLKAATVVNGVFTGMWLTDAHNGLRAMSSQAAIAIRISENRMAHASELLVEIKKNNLRYCERPTHIVYTDYSRSHGQHSLNSINIFIDLMLKKIT